MDLKSQQMQFTAFETPINIPDRKIVLDLCRLASNNDITLTELLDDIKKKYNVDTSKFSRTKDDEVIYPNGKIGIPLDLTDEEEYYLHKAAYISNVNTNDFIVDAIETYITEYPEKNKKKKK